MPKKQKFYLYLGLAFWTLTLVFALLPVWPYFYYRISPKASDSLASTIAYTVSEPAFATNNSSPTASENTFPIPIPTPTPDLPDLDPSLPTNNGLIIDKIGVRGEIHEGDNWQDILKQGIWRVPNFGSPLETDKPIILAAHRWGYLSWSSAFRKLNSFYNLPQLKVGDQVQIVWGQRKFVYNIYSVSSGTAITDYSADLILYTCQLWNSPVRFFVYATRSQ